MTGSSPISHFKDSSSSLIANNPYLPHLNTAMPLPSAVIPTADPFWVRLQGLMNLNMLLASQQQQQQMAIASPLSPPLKPPFGGLSSIPNHLLLPNPTVSSAKQPEICEKNSLDKKSSIDLLRRKAQQYSNTDSRIPLL